MQKKNISTFGCLALAGFLSACNSENATNPIASTTPATPSRTSPPQQQSGPISLDEMFSTGGGLSELHADELEMIEAGMSCSLDSVNAATPGSAPVSGDTALALSGWYQYKPGSTNEVIAVMRGERSYAFPLITGNTRPDIARIIGTTDAISDVTGVVEIESIPAGEYSIYYVRNGGGGLAKCVADSTIAIN